MSDLHHLGGAYALDALSPEERRAFEAHYPDCEICTADVDAYREVVAHLATATAEEPPASLRGDVLDRIGRTRQVSPLEPSRTPARPRWLPLAAAAVLLLAVGALVVAVSRGTADDTDDELAQLVAAPDAELLTLDTDEPGTLTVVWSEATSRAAVVGSDVVGVGGDQRYALWLLDDAGAQPAGLFAPDDQGDVRAVVDLGGRPSGWGVTIEPS
ncbi:MAG: anti-sigma factor, partial [Acidimicrobiia bacterium]|nr:anti-sigma factor [Acidimicrobiia bacterium]